MQPRYQYEIRIQKPGKQAIRMPFTEATWSGSRQEAKRTLAVKTNKGRDRFWPDVNVEEGDLMELISLFSGSPRSLFTGMVVDLGKTTKGDINPVAYDFGFYLLNNDVVVVSTGEAADRLITRIFQQHGIQIGGIGRMPSVEKQIIRGKSVWDAVVDILNQVYQATGIRYWCWIEQGKVYVGTQRGQTVQWKIQQGSNLLEASRKRSIANMRTVVRVVGSDNESAAILHEEVDQTNIKRYGRMVKVIEMRDKQKGSAVALGKQELQNLSKVKDEASVNGLGIDDVIAGNRVEVFEEITGLQGTYTVWGDSHTIRPGYHEMKLQLQMEVNGA
ncbi:XkdQ/YqbQ family protein [Brevibacillus sp. NRS-1366]|uniref:XkdQ/YqbQ family protein n=1 Tax=Brevibacillus sp. NRS-1366 TaxID=3233899 RepID=UPI003D1A9FB4